MNIFIATFIKCKSIYVDEKQVYNQNNPAPYKLAEILGKCGYVLGKDLYGWISPEYENTVLEGLGEYLEKTFGVDKTWKGVYVSVDQIPEKKKSEIDQLLIYQNPDYINETRDTEISDAWEKNNYSSMVVLGKATKDELIKVISGLISNPLPLGNQDSEILDFGLDTLDLIYPDKINCKEIFCRVLRKGHGQKCISGINDILRVITYISYGDTTLIENDRIKLCNKDRRLVLGLLEGFLENNANKFYDAKKYYQKWVIVAQVLHTSESKYPRAYEFFKIIRGYDKSWMHESFGSKLQRAYDRAGENGSLKEVVNLLSTRGGEFVRRFDSVLRRAWENKDPYFSEIGEKLLSIQGLRPKTLLDLYRMYNRRNLESPRSYVDKSGVRQTYTALKPLDQDLINLTQSLILSKLRNIYGEDKTLQDQKFYIDIPSEVDLCLSLRNGVKGQVFPGQIEHFEKTGILRFFTQWIDPDGKEDLDIHAWFVNDDLSECRKIGWNSDFLDPEKRISYSGDVRFVKGNCAEYISVDFRKNADLPYRWMIVGVQNFEHPHLSSLENYVGVAKISGEYNESDVWGPESNEILFRAQVTVEEKNLIGYLVDFKESTVKYILEGTQQNLATIHLDLLKLYTIPGNLSVRKLLEMYIKAKGGIIVEEPDKETKIYSLENLEEITKMLLGE